MRRNEMQAVFHAGGKFIIGIACILIASVSCAQKAELKMVDSSRLVTKLKYYSDEHLHTSHGAIPYISIYSVRFNSKDRKKAEFFLEMLDSMKIKVIFADAPITDIPFGSSKLADSLAQSSEPPQLAGAVGIGGGLDYGGIGIRAGLNLIQQLMVFGGLGYTEAGLGYNAGMLFIAKPKSAVSLTMSAMYGYNAYSTSQDKIYYGPSASVGVRYLVGKRHVNFWHVSVIYPFRNFDNTGVNPGDFLPVLPSFGFNFGISKK
jgi:hypothetical protein